MPKASDLSPDYRFMGLFVGDSGCGKTAAAASFPGPVDIADFDGRIRGLLGAPWVDRSQISYDYYAPKNAKDDTQAVANYIKISDKYESYLKLSKAGQLHLKTTVLDSLTSFNFAMIKDSVAMTHQPRDNKQVGKWIGKMPMADPGDYGFEAESAYNIIAYLKSVPVENVIVTAHTIDRFGKEDEDDSYSPTVVVGKRLSLRDKIAVNIMKDFDHVFEFSRSDGGGSQGVKYWVKFHSDIARTSYPGFPTGKIDITGKHFYNDVLMKYVKKETK